jgi:hypothetical protein
MTADRRAGPRAGLGRLISVCFPKEYQAVGFSGPCPDLTQVLI